jgi:FtsH-binding integral membrane protein
MWFDIAMIGLAGTSILYDTSKIMYRYGKNRYVAAALDLFSSVALMFWYCLRLLRRVARSHGRTVRIENAATSL